MDVEQDDTICRVTLSADGPVYAHGSLSTSTVMARKRMVARTKTLCAESMQRLAGILVSAYTHAGGKPLYLPEINAFLICALYYITTFTSPGDWTLQSLTKLAETLRIGPRDAQSAFSILCMDEINNCTPQSRMMERYYEDYTSHAHRHTPARINEAILLVRAQLCAEYAVGTILYRVIPKEDKHHV